MPIHIRPTRESDFPAVLRLLEQLWVGRSLDEQAVRSVFQEALISDRHIYLSSVDTQNRQLMDTSKPAIN
jgi:hypothetical protein